MGSKAKRYVGMSRLIRKNTGKTLLCFALSLIMTVTLPMNLLPTVFATENVLMVESDDESIAVETYDGEEEVAEAGGEDEVAEAGEEAAEAGDGGNEEADPGAPDSAPVSGDGFFTDFGDNVLGTWYSARSSGGTASLATDVALGKKVLKLSNLGNGVAMYNTEWPQMEDFTFTARMRTTTSNPVLGMAYRGTNATPATPSAANIGLLSAHSYNNNNIEFKSYTGSAESYANLTTQNGYAKGYLKANEWYVLSMTLDDTGVEFYIDGVLVAQNSYTPASSPGQSPGGVMNRIKDKEGYFGFSAWGSYAQNYEIDWVSISPYGTGGAVASVVPALSDVSVADGGAVVLDASAAQASNGGILSFRWQSSTDNVTWTDIAGASGAEYSFTAGTVNDGTYYRCAVINTDENSRTNVSYTNAAQLTIGSGGTSEITTQPKDTVAALGGSATFTVGVTAASGITPVYKWQVSTNNGAWTDISGANAASYTVSNTASYANNGNKYRVGVKFGGNEYVYSDVALLMVQKDWESTSAFYTTFGANEAQLDSASDWRTVNGSGVPTGNNLEVVTDPSAFNDKALKMNFTDTGNHRIEAVPMPDNITDGEYAIRFKAGKPNADQYTDEIRMALLFRTNGSNFQEMARSGAIWSSESQAGYSGGTLTAQYSPSGLVSPGVWHTLRMTVYGDRVSVWFDDALVIDNQKSNYYTPTGGSFGIRSFFTSQQFFFDNMYAGPIRDKDDLPDEFTVTKEAPAAEEYQSDYAGTAPAFINAQTLASYPATYEADSEAPGGGAVELEFAGTAKTGVIDTQSGYIKDLNLEMSIKPVPEEDVIYTYADIVVDDNDPEKEAKRRVKSTGDFGVVFHHESGSTFAVLYYDAATRVWSLRDANDLNTTRVAIGTGPVLRAEEWATVRMRANDNTVKLWVTGGDGEEQLVGTARITSAYYPRVAGRVGVMSGKEAKTLYLADSVNETIFVGVQEPGMEPAYDPITIASSAMTVKMDNRYPVPNEYTLTNGNKKLMGYEDYAYTLEINGEEWFAYVESVEVSSTNSSNDTLTYTVYAMEDISVPNDYIEFRFVYTVKGAALTCEVTLPEGDPGVYTVEMPDIYFAAFANGMLGSTTTNVRMAGFVNPGSWNNMSDYFNTMSGRGPSSNMYSIGFISNGNVAAGIWNDSPDTPTRNIISILEADASTGNPMTMTLRNGPWTYAANTASYGAGSYAAQKFEPLEKMAFTVVVADDNNSSGSADWQDAANLYRDYAVVPTGASEIRDYYTYVSMNFVSMAQNPFLRGLDDAKKLANYTDGFGQMILEKGYQAEGHDDSHPDVGGHIGIRQGGVTDFRTLISEAHKINARVGIHVNVGEYMKDSFFGPPSSVYTSSNGWGWLDQAILIDQNKDLMTGELEKRFQILYDEVGGRDSGGAYTGKPNDGSGLDMVYVDIYYSGSDWRAKQVSNILNGFKWINATEFSGPMEQNVIWTHWGTDLYYPTSGDGSQIFRYIYNDTKDAFPTSSRKVSTILRGANQAGIGAWQSRSSITEGVEVFYNQNLASKYMQYFPVNSWADNNLRINFGAPREYTYDADGNVTGFTTVAGKAGAYATATALGGETRVYSPDGNLVAVMGAASGSTYSRKEASELFIPWSPITEEKIYYWQGKTSGGQTSWTFPASWGSNLSNSSVKVYKLTDVGPVEVTTGFTVSGNTFTPNVNTLGRKVPYVIYKANSGKTPMTAGDFGATTATGANSTPGYLADPGFDTHGYSAWTVTSGSSNVAMTTDNRGNSRMEVAGQTSGNEIGVENTIRNLTPGQTYTASIWYQVGGNGAGGAPATTDKRNVTLSVLNGATQLATTTFNRTTHKNLDFTNKWYQGSTATGDATNSPTPYMSRLNVAFTATGTTATFRLQFGNANAKVYLDDARIWHHPYAPKANAPTNAYYFTDFENIYEQWGPFVYARTGDNNHTHLVEKAPATVDLGGTTVNTQQLENYVLDGRWSLKAHNDGAYTNFLVTTPNTLELKAGKTYRVEFDYNVSVAYYTLGVYNGNTLLSGTAAQTLAATGAQNNPSQQRRFSYTFTVPAGAGENCRIGISTKSNPSSIHTMGLVIDNFAVYES